MRILVQKFGGTSLSTRQARSEAARHIARALEEGYAVVVVVSAMGRYGDPYATDSLLDLIRQNGGSLPRRETDLLLSCGELIAASVMCSLLSSQGIPSTVMTGGQAGIQTDERHGNARIRKVNGKAIIERLKQGFTVIVTGFQGQSESGELTTLGRGGSDTTATALGAALHAEAVEIYTDVDGILTADPKIVHDAKPLAHISYAEVCNLANYGAKVIHPRAVEIAMHAQIPIHIRSTFSDSEGTWVRNGHSGKSLKSVTDRYVTGIAHTENITQIQVDTEGAALDLHSLVFKAMAQAEISVDFINVNPSSIVYTVHDRDAARAVDILGELGIKPRCKSSCAKVAVIGGGINGVPGIMSAIVSALAERQIAILQSADSNTTIWVLINRTDMESALRALHETFGLGGRS